MRRQPRRVEQAYTVEEPDSNDKALTVPNTVVNTGGQLDRVSGVAGTVGKQLLNSAVDYYLDTGLGGKLLRAGADKIVEMIKTRRNRKKATPIKGGKPPKQRQQQAVVVERQRPLSSASGNGVMMSRAPVALGATISGSRTLVTKAGKGHMLRGREFLTSAYGTGNITTWTMCAGIPLTPVVFVDSMLQQYGKMYSYFRWKRLAVHYVTTSPTSSNGSVMIYYNKDRASTYLNQTSPNLLPFVLSDPHTTISPQWQNMTVVLETDSEWKRLDYGKSDDVGHFAAGEVFLLSKTSTTESPGYLLMTYEIELKDENLTPRLLLWPQPTISYVPYLFNWPAVGGGSAVTFSSLAGTSQIGTNTNRLLQSGVYKVILDVSNSTTSSVSPTPNFSLLWSTTTPSVNVALIDGTTIYGICNSSSITLYPNAEDAFAAVNPLLWSNAQSNVTGASIQIWTSLVGFIGTSDINPSM